jgi:hypothetical protein
VQLHSCNDYEILVVKRDMEMEKLKIFIVLISVFGFLSCSKDNVNQQTILIPNGDFENWNTGWLQNWETNSCPPCVPPYDPYVIKQDSSAYHGQYAAKFIYNNVYAAWAQNKFSVPKHPSNLTSYVKCDLYGSDTVSIKIKLFYNGAIVDSGQWLGTSSIGNYKKIDIPITQNSSKVDTALIRIEGGHKLGYPNKNTEFWVDYLTLQ